jgi:hypothetical protein
MSTKCRDAIVSLPQYTATLLDPCVASRALAVEASAAARSANVDVRDIFARKENTRSKQLC